MALNFGLLGDAGAPAMGYLQGQQDVARNQLAQQQVETGRMTQDKMRMEMDSMRRRQAGLDQFMQKAKELGVDGDPEQLARAFYDQAVATSDPQQIQAATIAVQAARERKAYMGGQPGAGGAVSTPVPMTNISSAALPAQANAMAPAAAPAQGNALAGNRLSQIENRLVELRQFPNAGAQERADLINERNRLMTPYVVSGNLVSGAGDVLFTAPQNVTPTDTARLIAERDKFPLGSPNRALYDQQIANLGATAQNARDRLAFDQSKFNYERANPGKTIKEVTQADGSTQVFAIDNRTGMATQVMMAGAPGAAPAGGGRGAVGVPGGQVGPGTPLVGAKASNAQLNEGERKAATLLQRLQFSESQLTDALLDDPNASKPGLFASAVAKLSTPLANALTPENRQRVESAQLDILDAALTLGTGAAYTSEQLEGYRKSYFPQIGDSPKAILDKQARLNNVIAAAKIAAGRAEKLVPAPVPAAGASDVRNAADKIIKGK